MFKDWIIEILESNNWNWDQFSEFANSDHSIETNYAGEDAWGECFPEWSGSDMNNDNVVDVEDVRML